jgi:arylsulfatase A-like enzyme
MSKHKKVYLFIAFIIVLISVIYFLPQRKSNISLVEFNPKEVPKEEIGKHPNILLVIADDMGIDMDPCHPDIGDEKPYMPNLSLMCKKGVTFNNVWTNPVCSPTRSTMMSGQYGFRTGVTDVNKILSPDTETLADILADQGKVPVPYANAFIGKWHMSGSSADLNAPSLLGVQYFAGFLAGGVKDYFKYPLIEQGVRKQGSEYTTTVFTDKAISWINNQTEKDPNRPWFMWLAYNAPHVPFHLPPKDLITNQTLSGSSEDIKNNPRKYYLASLEALDKEMGRLMSSIPRDVLANTTIIFMGDNGTPSEVIQKPFSKDKAKTTVYEGGVSGVLTVSGKGVVRSGVYVNDLVNGADVFATVLDIAGADVSKMDTKDSISFKPILTSDVSNDRNFLYSEWVPAKGPKRDTWAIRDDRYKLIYFSDKEKELYDLVSDPYENNNLMKSKLDPNLENEIKKLEKLKNDL